MKTVQPAGLRLDLGDALASAYIHRLRPAQARMLSGLTSAELPTDLFSLAPGTAYLVTTAGELRPVIIPQMTAGDVARVAALAGAQALPVGAPAPTPAPTPGRPLGFRAVGASVGAPVGDPTPPLRRRQDAGNLTPEEAEILAGFLGGKSPSDLAAELAGGRKAGDAYGKAARRVAALAARLLGGRPRRLARRGDLDLARPPPGRRAAAPRRRGPRRGRLSALRPAVVSPGPRLPARANVYICQHPWADGPGEPRGRCWWQGAYSITRDRVGASISYD